MLQNILYVIFGIVFGIANVIPGVSGGTMMVVFGIYDKLIGVFSLNLSEIKKNLVFLIFFGIGAVCGIVGFSFVITWLLQNFPVATNMFFMGLITGSIPLIYRCATVKDKIKPSCLISFTPALALVVGLTVLDNYVNNDSYKIIPEKTDSGYSITVENISGHDMKGDWTIKIPVKIEGQPENCVIKKSSDNSVTLTGAEGTMIKNGESLTVKVPTTAEITEQDISFNCTYQMNTLLFLTLLGGAILASVAMIIPGVSGSFIMVLLGIYPTVIGSIKSFDIITMIPVGIGVVIGIVFGAKLIGALMKRFSLMVYSAIMGLVIGSLYAVLPEGIGLNMQTLIGVFSFALGAFAAYITGKHTTVEGEEEKDAETETATATTKE